MIEHCYAITDCFVTLCFCPKVSAAHIVVNTFFILSEITSKTNFQNLTKCNARCLVFNDDLMPSSLYMLFMFTPSTMVDFIKLG